MFNEGRRPMQSLQGNVKNKTSTLCSHEKKHSKTECSICENVIHIQNMKRHMENNHKGETPSITKWKHAQKQKKESLHKKYSCLECRKYFFDKSNLNILLKKHNYKCHMCEKSFFNEKDLKSHL